jgi:hypothetical protein
MWALDGLEFAFYWWSGISVDPYEGGGNGF